MVLDLCQNFVSTQNLENKWILFHALMLAIVRFGFLSVIFAKGFLQGMGN